METKNKMGTMAMSKLIINMSLPLMISLLVQSLYNIVDSVFVARIGEDALTATSLAFPVQLLMIAVAVGTSVGINALLSKSIGAKDYEVTENIAATGVILAGAGTLVFVILGIFCSGWFVSLSTDEKTIGAFCEEYLSICMIFCAGTFVGTMFQRSLQSIGDTFDSMVTLIAGALTNLILDPIFIFGLAGLPAYGIKGAAMATVIGQWGAAIPILTLCDIYNVH
ncbi:MATE family efflux transporter [Bariatricus sp. SGI.019]|uniref:MATE family efflux transporter n=1 Tax=Bariatricus sp. SGI.019 TaxID=3420548 RepID=UPI003D04D6F0